MVATSQQIDFAPDRQLAASGFLGYVTQRFIDTRPEPMPFGAVADSWQIRLAEAVAPAVDWLAGIRNVEPKYRYFWWELCKGHEKTGLCASIACFLARYSRNVLRGCCAASTREQAQLLRNAMETERRLNEDLLDMLHVGKREPKGPGGSLRVLSSDQSSGEGELPDFTVADEVTVWDSQGLWDTLHGNAIKRPRSVFIVITNAGYTHTWQHDQKLTAEESGEWHIFTANGKLASWIPDEEYAKARRYMIPSEARRKLDNIWIGSSDTPLIHEEWLALAMGHPKSPLGPYTAGVDVAYMQADKNIICVCGATGMLCAWEVDITSGGGRPSVLVLCDEIKKLINGDWFWTDPEDGVKSRGFSIFPRDIRIDASEGAGKAVYDFLAKDGIFITPERFGASPSQASPRNRFDAKLAGDLYANRRAELYGELAKRLNPQMGDEFGFSLRTGYRELEQELLAHEDLRNNSGKLVLPPKDGIRERLKRSPDWSDALVMAAWRDQKSAYDRALAKVEVAHTFGKMDEVDLEEDFITPTTQPRRRDMKKADGTAIDMDSADDTLDWILAGGR